MTDSRSHRSYAAHGVLVLDATASRHLDAILCVDLVSFAVSWAPHALAHLSSVSSCGYAPLGRAVHHQARPLELGALAFVRSHSPAAALHSILNFLLHFVPV